MLLFIENKIIGNIFEFSNVMKKLFLFLLIIINNNIFAQLVPDSNYSLSIKSVKLFQQNNQTSLPIINLNSSDLIELHFDDLDGYIKSYYYTYVLCNADWTESALNPFDYIKGFTQNRIVQSRPASVTLSKYVHYQATLPEKNCIPSKSGNYLLKIFLNGDADNVVFTKRMYVVNSQAAIAMQVRQPFDNNYYSTHQKIQFSVNTSALPNLFNPSENIKITLLQNQRWDNALTKLKPAFIRENVLEYDGERECLFEAGKEYRWVDLRSFRFESDRILRKDETKTPIDIYVKLDATRVAERYLFWKDLNGWYDVTTTDLVNNWWQTGYANVHFTYKPENNQPYAGQEIYLMGEFTGNKNTNESKMEYNAEKGVYEKTLLLKQAYYFYNYVTKNVQQKNAIATTALTEGNNWETENTYTLFVYYRSFSGRYDELVGVTTANSRLGKLF